MSDALAPGDFSAFFRAVWGYEPFPWQQRLVDRLAGAADADPWPDLLDLPTGSGKTATLDIALFHLALEAAQGERRRAPVRIAFVVDRRLIVDDAHNRALALAAHLGKAAVAPEAADSALRKVAAALCGFAGPGRPPLIARRLRGGAPREDDWAVTPVQPTILCSTVDQVGSRLLFRGYGVSDSMKPVHAGLLGSDCLILLDEAHLAEPFRQTLAAIRDRGRPPDEAPFGFAVLTATPALPAERPFALDAADRLHPRLSARLAAAKPARLVEISDRQGVDAEQRRAEAVAEAAIQVFDRLKASGIENPAVGVVLNRVARARAVFERLVGTAPATLLIGPARAVDRDRLAEELAPIRTRTAATRALDAPLIVVATQTIEAGVDIDFDGLVTEAAALDALRQRFGRLNRAGRPVAAEAVVLAHRKDLGARADDDPVYGDRIRATWELLSGWAAADAGGTVDLGIAAMAARMADLDLSDFTVKPPSAPVLMPAYVDLWSETAPVPRADPEVALFLHGPGRSRPGVQIVWRADLGDGLRAGDLERLVELLTLVPPRAAEAVEVPLWAAGAFLRRAAARQDFSDAGERAPPESDDVGRSRPALRWAGEDSARTGLVRAGDLAPGDLIVVPADYGGCDRWGWSPAAEAAVGDVAEEAAWPYRARRFAVRVHPALVAQEGGDGGGVLEALADHAEDTPVRLLEAVLGLELPPALKARLERLRDGRHGRLESHLAYGFDAEERPRGVVFVAPGGIGAAAPRPGAPAAAAPQADENLAAVPATESDDLGTGSDRPVLLRDHCRDVAGWAEGFAVRAGLPAPRLADLRLAGRLHDLGKADPRYQSYYAGGDPYGPDLAAPLAKSGRKRLPRSAWQRAGLPDDWRHEALSVRLAAIHPDFATARDPALVLWLIGTHHGFGRPFFPHADARDQETRPGLLRAFGVAGDLAAGPGPQSLAFEFGGRDWTEMFAALKARYGVWGLARLEAFVRLADHRASEAGAPAAGAPAREAAE